MNRRVWNRQLFTQLLCRQRISREKECGKHPSLIPRPKKRQQKRRLSSHKMNTTLHYLDRETASIVWVLWHLSVSFPSKSPFREDSYPYDCFPVQMEIPSALCRSYKETRRYAQFKPCSGTVLWSARFRRHGRHHYNSCG